MFRTGVVSPEAEIVARLKQRDAQAMGKLYDMYGKLIYSVILRAVRNEATAEDITQETFLRIWTRIHTFDETKGALEGWVVTVARNRAFDYLRTVRGAESASAVSLDEVDPSRFVDRQGGKEESLDAGTIQSSLRSLSEDQRAVIELTHFEGLTQSEIARRLNKPLGTVKGLARSALKLLRTSVVGGLA